MTDWLSASGMLLAGAIVGFMFLYGMKRRQQRGDLERADLEAKRDALIARLREGGSDPRLEREAAEVLRKLDGLSGGQPPSAVPAAVPSSSRRRTGRLSLGTFRGEGVLRLPEVPTSRLQPER
jgi:hypothetical protein